MKEVELKAMLKSLVGGEISTEQAIIELKNSLLRNTKLGYAQPDHHRVLRHGLNEVIYGEGKPVEQIVEIAMKLAQNEQCVLITRLNAKKLTILKNEFPNSRANAIAKTLILNPPDLIPADLSKKFVAIISAGTSDMKVAEEASEVCIAMNIAVQRIYDIGVSGLHRLFDSIDIIQKASAVVVVAGMEGALPSVIGGIVGAPVIAVPTSVGYGASFQGLAALLAMLNSCAPGMVVTNIDAGFSAGFAAARILNRMDSGENTLS